MSDHSAPEPAPVPSVDSRALFGEVIKDFESRQVHGIETYGTTLFAFNGRRSGIDAYQEQMDNLLYLKQLNIELDALGILLDRLTVDHQLDGRCCAVVGGPRDTRCTALAQIRVTAIQIGLIREVNDA